MYRDAIPVPGSADGLHGRGIGAELLAQRSNNDINDVAGRWISVSPHRFHEVIATHGFSRAFLQVLHDAKLERPQPDAARAQYELMGLDIEHSRGLEFLRRDFSSNQFRQPGID